MAAVASSEGHSDHRQFPQSEQRALRKDRFVYFSNYLFNPADFLLDYACEFFVLAFGHQVGIVRGLSRFLLNCAFYFMKLAFDLILRARFHLFSPLFFRKLLKRFQGESSR